MVGKMSKVGKIAPKVGSQLTIKYKVPKKSQDTPPVVTSKVPASAIPCDKGMTIDMMPLDGIKPYWRNPRRNEAAVRAVRASIDEFGWRQPIVVDEHNVIIMGHTRRLAAIEREDLYVPVHKAIGLTPEKVKALRLADNKVAEIAEWDAGLLMQELLDLSDSNIDMSAFGFSDADMQAVNEEVKKDIRYLENFEVLPTPKPQWILIKAPEDVAAVLTADLRKKKIKDVVVHYSGESPP